MIEQKMILKVKVENFKKVLFVYKLLKNRIVVKMVFYFYDDVMKEFEKKFGMMCEQLVMSGFCVYMMFDKCMQWIVENIVVYMICIGFDIQVGFFVIDLVIGCVFVLFGGCDYEKSLFDWVIQVKWQLVFMIKLFLYYKVI